MDATFRSQSVTALKVGHAGEPFFVECQNYVLHEQWPQGGTWVGTANDERFTAGELMHIHDPHQHSHPTSNVDCHQLRRLK
jgi:hypothetical protein